VNLTSPIPLLAVPVAGPPSVRPGRIERGVLAAGVGSALIGALVLVGWALDAPALREFGMARGAMNPITALGLMALGIALPASLAPRGSLRLTVSHALAAMAAAVGALKVAVGLANGPFTLDAALFGEAMAHSADGRSNHMAPAAAALFLTLGLAIISAGRRTRVGDAVAQTLAIVTLLLAQMALLGHSYQRSWFESVGAFSRMVPHTAFAFSLLAAGVLGARPESGIAAVLSSSGPGGAMARRMLPAGLLLPAALGWLVLLGRREGLFVPQLAEMLFVLAVTLAFSVLVAWNAVQLHHTHVQHERAVAALRDSEARFRLLAEYGQDMVSILSPEGLVLYASPSCERLLGFTPVEFARMQPFAFLHPEDQPRAAANHAALLRGDPAPAATYRALHKAGHHVWLESLARAVVDVEGGVRHLHVASRDITERKMYEARLDAAHLALEEQHAQLLDANTQLEALATLDGLTNLKNRRAFAERLSEEVSRSRRAGTPVSLLMFDIDHFKQFNDAFGHPRGDDVLRLVGRLLQRAVRDTDFAARYGGEEFAVILPDTTRDEARLLAERLRHAVESAEWLERGVTVSVGTATLHADTVAADTLVEQADRALYRSKERGRNVVSTSGE
jgi:diguanylate cyclase (GGDEF)-like protein/PAS domain S-box-containing protein